MTDVKCLGIAGTQSGSGKTLVTMAYIRLLERKGGTVQPFKVGPDFIDPLYHESVAHRPSINLDRFFMTSQTISDSMENYLSGADIGLVEGVMGLFDGKSGRPGEYSTAQLYRELGIPYVLVVNASGQSHSIAATVKGFLEYDSSLDCLGVIFTRVASDRHESMLKRAVEGSLDLPVLGCLGDRDSLRFPSRHLGLDTAFLFNNDNDLSDSLDESVTPELNLPDGLTDSTTSSGGSNPNSPESVYVPRDNPRTVIGVAWDEAFHFYYDFNLRKLKEAGAKLLKISPLEDRGLPKNLDGLYLGGGYPEQFAEDLMRNTSFVNELRDRLTDGLVVLAECGGFMYLGERLADRAGDTHGMIGWFDTTIRQNESLGALGYVQGEATPANPFLEAGRKVKGHEFHYSELTSIEVSDVAVELSEGAGLGDRQAGLVKGNTMGSYVHWHFGAVPRLATGFVDHCATRRSDRVQSFV